jgi:hypothetical protein
MKLQELITRLEEASRESVDRFDDPDPEVYIAYKLSDDIVVSSMELTAEGDLVLDCEDDER